MHRFFFRFFISVFTIAVLIIFIQAAMLVSRYMVGEDRWMEQIFNSFVNMTVNAVNNIDSAERLKKEFRLMVSNSIDDRVSGFIIRDSAGNIVFTAGKTPKGKPLSIGQEDIIQIHRPVVMHSHAKRPKYSGIVDISIVPDYRPSAVFTSVDSSSFGELYIPENIAATDIVGSVKIKINGEEQCTIDLLAFSPMTYEYTKDVAHACANSFFVSAFVCLAIALIGAGAISSSNAKFIDSVRNALGRLASGEENIKLLQPKSHYLNDIFISIHDLDKSLQANAKSRSMWLNSISHDLNTPAMSMKVIIDGISDGIFKPDADTLLQLKEENNVLNSRIARVTELSEVMSGTVPVLDTVDSRIFSSNVLSVPGCITGVITEIGCPFIVCDCTLMEKACTEILKNAAMYTTDASSVVWTIRENDTSYIMEFSDTGMIRCSGNASSLFEPWICGDYARNGTGNGLGLPIAGAIMSLHKGSAEIRQEENRVVVTFSWPKSDISHFSAGK